MVNEDNNSSINFITDEIIENIAIRNIHNILNNNMQITRIYKASNVLFMNQFLDTLFSLSIIF